jgi:hypothetical protein
VTAALDHATHAEQQERDAVERARAALLTFVQANPHSSVSAARRHLSETGAPGVAASEAFVTLVSEGVLSLSADRRLDMVPSSQSV